MEQRKLDIGRIRELVRKSRLPILMSRTDIEELGTLAGIATDIIDGRWSPPGRVLDETDQRVEYMLDAYEAQRTKQRMRGRPVGRNKR